jgi:hypothetical protein
MYEANVVFGAAKRLTAFGARTFLLFLQQMNYFMLFGAGSFQVYT